MNLDILERIPSGSTLVQALLEGGEPATRWFGADFRDREAYRERAAAIEKRFDRDAREAAASALRAHTPDPDRLERWVEEGGYTVTTGQQPGLLGGPLYSLYKALTAVRLAEALEKVVDRPVLPVFWIASEDHDWEEVDHSYLVDLDNTLIRPTVDDPRNDDAPALHRIPVESWPSLLDELQHALPDTDFTRDLFGLLNRACSEGTDLPRHFHTLLAGWTEGTGLAFVQAHDPALKEASSKLLLDDLRRSAEIEEVLRERAAEITGAGHPLQVPILDEATNLFLDGPEGRERLFRDPETGADGTPVYRLRRSGARLTADEIEGRFAADPSVLSPGVLLRPIVESAVFPTLAYVAGPGEMTYWAQLPPSFEAHGIRMPVVHPRWGATLVESKIRKVLEKFELELEELDKPFDRLAGEIARDDVPPEIRRAVGQLRGTVAKGVGEVADAVKALDPTLKGPAEHVRSAAFSAIDDLDRKISQAVKRENEIALEQLRKAQEHLYPNGKPQERVLSAIYYLARYGPDLVGALRDRFAVDVGTDLA